MPYAALMFPYHSIISPIRTRNRVLLTLVIALGILVLLFLTLPLAHTEAGNVNEYTKTDFMLSEDDELPETSSSLWQPQALPDSWWQRHVGTESGWYKLIIPSEHVPSTLQGIYIPRLNMNAAVYFNGVQIGNGGQMHARLTRNWNRPLYFTLPQSLWHTGNNALIIHLKAYPGVGMLSPLIIGPDEILKPIFLKRQFLQNEVTQIFAALLVLIGAFSLGLWYLRRQDSVYLWFGASSLCWAAFNLHLFVRDPPIQGGLFLWFAHASLDFWMVFLVGFVHRHLGVVRLGLERSLIVVQGTLALIFLYPMVTYDLNFVSHAATTHAISIAAAIYLMLLAWQRWRTEPSHHTLGLSVVFTLLVLAGLHDWVMENPMPGLIPQELLVTMWTKQFHLLFFMAPVLILFVVWQLVIRFIDALNESEKLNAELETRVAAAQAVLATSFAARHDLEMLHAATVERERIYRDLHDDVGAKLLGLVISAQSANMPHEADLARSALQDLRDVVSRSAQPHTPLGDLIADWRAETEQRFDSLVANLEWTIPAKELPQLVSTETALNLSRILREAITNVLRHAQATQIIVNAMTTSTELILCIEDNGIGFIQENTKPHRGMRSMRARATALCADISWQSIMPNGCRLMLVMPLANLPLQSVKRSPHPNSPRTVLNPT